MYILLWSIDEAMLIPYTSVLDHHPYCHVPGRWGLQQTTTNTAGNPPLKPAPLFQQYSRQFEYPQKPAETMVPVSERV